MESVRLKKYILVAVITQLATSLVLFQLFYYMLINATATFGYNINNKQIVSIDIGIEQFNYWEE